MENNTSLSVGYQSNNSHWQIILDRIEQQKSGGGKPVGYQMSAEDLWEEAIKYFHWCDQNPINRGELMRGGKKAGTVYNQKIQRPYTVMALCLHAGITPGYLYDCAKSKDDNPFYFVATNILSIIYAQKFELAVVGIYNPVMISNELGIGKDHKSEKGSANISITVDGSAPALLEDENDIDTSQIENQKND